MTDHLVDCGDVIDCLTGPWLVVMVNDAYYTFARIPYWDNELGYGKTWTLKDVTTQLVPRRTKWRM